MIQVTAFRLSFRTDSVPAFSLSVFIPIGPDFGKNRVSVSNQVAAVGIPRTDPATRSRDCRSLLYFNKVMRPISISRYLYFILL